MGAIRLVPARLVSGLVGRGAGALIGHLHGDMSLSDLKVKKEVRAQAKEIEKAIDQA